jgi:16S rRNA processing protein RimM
MSTGSAEPHHVEADDLEAAMAEPGEPQPGMVEVVVGRVGRAHGVRGEVRVAVLTDDPDRRFEPGARLWVETPRQFHTSTAPVGELTVQAVRRHQERLLVTFDQVVDRGAAEALAGAHLVARVARDEPTGDDDTWFDHQLTGLRVRLTDGTDIGRVGRLDHGAAQDLLVVEGRHGGQALVPFVARIVPEVDVAGGVIILDPPPGLLDDLHPPRE